MNFKSSGITSELVVASKLAELGCTISFPYGDNATYDLICDNHNKLLKIQVKSVSFQDCQDRNCVYRVTLGRGKQGKKLYDANEVDFFIVHVPNLEEFYVIPQDAAKLKMNLGAVANKFKDQWNLIMNKM